MKEMDSLSKVYIYAAWGSIAIAFVTGVSDAILWCLLFFILAIVFVIAGITRGVKVGKEQIQREESLKREVAMMLSYDSSTINLKKRGSKLRSFFSIQEAYNYTVGYTPETLHIGAVSVGGVVSGGTFKTGDEHFISDRQKSGRYMLMYKNGSDEGMVTKIKLSNELFEKAKNSPIAMYLNEAEKQIDVHESYKMSDFERRMLAQDVANRLDKMYVNKGAYATNISNDYPTEEKCRKILNWICNE